MMDVYEAVASRRSVRGFTDEPVSRELLERVLSAAAWSPSGSNIQPWNIYVMTGAPLAELKTLAVACSRPCHADSCGGCVLLKDMHTRMGPSCRNQNCCSVACPHQDRDHPSREPAQGARRCASGPLTSPPPTPVPPGSFRAP